VCESAEQHKSHLRQREMSENDTQAGRAHPLVGLLFWMMGKDLKAEGEVQAGKEKERSEENRDQIGAEQIQRRSLSWKDDTPDGALATWHEFADVKAPDVAIASEKPQNSSLKSGTTLHRKQNTIIDDEDEDTKKRRSPNSPNWGFFVSITPPTEIFPPSPRSTSSSKSAATGTGTGGNGSCEGEITLKSDSEDGVMPDIAFPVASSPAPAPVTVSPSSSQLHDVETLTAPAASASTMDISAEARSEAGETWKEAGVFPGKKQSIEG